MKSAGSHIVFLPMLFAWLLCGCSDLLESHPYDTHVDGATHINSRNVERIEARTGGKDSFKFAMISDTQRCYDETAEVVEVLNCRDDLDFVVHGGDLSDFGATKEFVWQRDILEQLRVPYVCVPGNHDLLGSGPHTFETIFGSGNFAFTAGHVRFLCLNTNVWGGDEAGSLPLRFLQQELDGYPAQARQTIFLMHCRPESDVFNNEKSREFQQLTGRFPHALFALHGHNHQLEVSALPGSALLYYQCPCVKKRMYLLFSVRQDGYDYEAVEF